MLINNNFNFWSFFEDIVEEDDYHETPVRFVCYGEELRFISIGCEREGEVTIELHPIAETRPRRENEMSEL